MSNKVRVIVTGERERVEHLHNQEGSSVVSENNIPFIWEGDDALPFEQETIERALDLAGRREEIERQDPAELLEIYYITDVPQTDIDDSRSISTKYGEEATLKGGQSYFLCLINPQSR